MRSLDCLIRRGGWPTLGTRRALQDGHRAACRARGRFHRDRRLAWRRAQPPVRAPRLGRSGTGADSGLFARVEVRWEEDPWSIRVLQTVRAQPRKEHGRRVGAGAIASLTGVGLLLIFMIQNRDDVTLDFLFWSFTWPLWLLTLVTALIGAVVWIGLGVMRRHRRRRARREDRRGLIGSPHTNDRQLCCLRANPPPEIRGLFQREKALRAGRATLPLSGGAPKPMCSSCDTRPVAARIIGRQVEVTITTTDPCGSPRASWRAAAGGGEHPFVRLHAGDVGPQLRGMLV